MILSPTIARPNKKQAFELIKNLISETELTAELESLYKFFLPTLPTKPKTPEQWVGKVPAKNQKDVRYYIHNIYVENGRMAGTDGHRLHMTDTNLEDGFYDFNSLDPISETAKYPNIDRVIPNHKKSDQVTVSSLKSKILESGLEVMELFETHIQADYFREACAGFDVVTVEHGTKNESILIKHAFGSAVVMPIRV